MFERKDLTIRKPAGKPVEPPVEESLIPAVELDEGKKHMHPPFVRGCVASVAKKQGHDTSRAFAICQSQYKKGDSKKKKDRRMTGRDDWSAKEAQYEKALSDARKLNKKK